MHTALTLMSWLGPCNEAPERCPMWLNYFPVMVRLDRSITLNIVLMQTVPSSRTMTGQMSKALQPDWKAL
jgi:hypothetical protein